MEPRAFSLCMLFLEEGEAVTRDSIRPRTPGDRPVRIKPDPIKKVADAPDDASRKNQTVETIRRRTHRLNKKSFMVEGKPANR